MHIGLVCYEYPPYLHGGVGTFSRDLAEGLVALGHAVTVIGIYPPWLSDISEPVHEILNGVNVYRLPSTRKLPSRFMTILDRIRLKRWLVTYHKKDPFDIIEAPEASGWLCFGGVAHVPLVLRFHGSQIYLNNELNRPGSRLLQALERSAIARADFLISVSEYVGRRTLELVNSKKSYSVIYNAIDLGKFARKPEMPENHLLIVFVGSLSSKKGVIELVKSMSFVWNSFPTASLCMVGKDMKYGTAGEKMSDYLHSLVDTNLLDRVIITGHVCHEAVAEYIAKATVCCYPSHIEAFSLAPLEAMAMGKPVIFMQHGSGPEAIEDGVSGLLCNTRSPEDIAEKIMMILEDRQLAKTLGENAQKRVSERFRKDRWIQKNIEFYEACLEKNRQREL